jgi:alkylated DNA repair dioxygenase AlkB
MNTELIQYACLPSDLNENILNELWCLRPEEQNKITMFGKIIDTPRRFKVYGKTYKFNGMTEEAEEEIPSLIIPYLNLINTIDSGYNSVLVNWYDGGNEYIGYHSDKTDYLVPDSNIYGISFGSERIMRFKHKKDNTLIDFKLEHNSIINMIGGCQSVFQHSIIQNKKINGKRISLTFRKIIDTNNIMEAKTRPKYNEFLKEWSQKNKITSFFGSDKPEFLQAWNNVKTASSKKVEPIVAAPVVEPVITTPVVEEAVKPKRTKETITFSEADKKKMEGMTRDERLNYAIRLSNRSSKENKGQELQVGDIYKAPNNLQEYGKFVTITEIKPKMVRLSYNITTIRDGEEVPVRLYNKINNKLLFKGLRTNMVLKTAFLGKRKIEPVEEKDQTKWVQKSITTASQFEL